MKNVKNYEEIMAAHPEVAAWLKDRPVNTIRAFAEKLMSFSTAMKISPEDWRRLDKFQARDIAWQYIEPLRKDQSAKASLTLVVLKSWYRNLNGEQLPFDSSRGGKHALRLVHKRAGIEHIPNKEEVYRIIDMAGNLRDKAILEVLFQSGIRVNALGHMNYGMVSGQLNKDLIDLKITQAVDEKLRGAGIDYYYTFINGEAVTTLRQYCELAHQDSKPDTPLFYTRPIGTNIGGSHVGQAWVWRIVKKCTERAGLDPQTIWTHSLRKAFRKVLTQSNIDDDDKEQLMGHTIQGSRSNYYDRHDVDWLRKTYQKLNFAREIPQSEVTKLKQQLEDEQSKRIVTEDRLERLEKELESTRELLKGLLAPKQR